MSRYLTLIVAVTGTVLLGGIVSAHASQITGTLGTTVGVPAAPTGSTDTSTGVLSGQVSSGSGQTEIGGGGISEGGNSDQGSLNAEVVGGISSGNTTAIVGNITNGSIAGGGSAGGGFAGGGSGVTLSSQTSCELLETPMRFGENNSPAEVALLQTVLNRLIGANLTIDGTFDLPTLNAVKHFQSLNENDILGPWGTSGPTGYVYVTTLKKLNELNCGVGGNVSSADISAITSRRRVSSTGVRSTPISSASTSSATASSPSVTESSSLIPQPIPEIQAAGTSSSDVSSAPTTQTASAIQGVGSFFQGWFNWFAHLFGG